MAKTYSTKPANPDWLWCKTCSATATKVILVHSRGRQKALGQYCTRHAAEKLAALRAKAQRCKE
jgi:hypothetical protein